MKKSNLNIDQLKRNKYSSPESKMKWLENALIFAQTPKKIVKKHTKDN